MELLTAAQDVTTGWVNMGEPIDMTAYRRMAIWPRLDINSSLNVRIRALPQRWKGDNQDGVNTSPITDVSLAGVGVNPEFFEFETDSDQCTLIEFETKGLVPWMQLQVQAGTVGATAGQITSCYLTKSNY